MKRGEAPKCLECGKAAFEAERVSAAGQHYHRACLRCATCRRNLTASSACSHEGKVYCKVHHPLTCQLAEMYQTSSKTSPIVMRSEEKPSAPPEDSKTSDEPRPSVSRVKSLAAALPPNLVRGLAGGLAPMPRAHRATSVPAPRADTQTQASEVDTEPQAGVAELRSSIGQAMVEGLRAQQQRHADMVVEPPSEQKPQILGAMHRARAPRKRAHRHLSAAVQEECEKEARDVADAEDDEEARVSRPGESGAMAVPRARREEGVAPEELDASIKESEAQHRRMLGGEGLLTPSPGTILQAAAAAAMEESVGSEPASVDESEIPTSLPPPMLEGAPTGRIAPMLEGSGEYTHMHKGAPALPRQMEAGGDWLLLPGDQLPSPSNSAPPSAPHSPVLHPVPHPAATPRVEWRVVHFSCLCGTRYGDAVFIAGNTEALGNWNPIAVPLRYVRPTSGTHEWAADVRLVDPPQVSGGDHSLEYKYVLVDGTGHVWWEQTANRWLPPTANTVYDIFGTINY